MSHDITHTLVHVHVPKIQTSTPTIDLYRIPYITPLDLYHIPYITLLDISHTVYHTPRPILHSISHPLTYIAFYITLLDLYCFVYITLSLLDLHRTPLDLYRIPSANTAVEANMIDRNL